MRGKIIFVSHEATLTGAPILLLNIIRCLYHFLNYDFVIVLGKDGPLRSQMEEFAEVLVFPTPLQSGYAARGMRVLGLLDAYNKYIRQRLASFSNVKIIFSNTIVNGELVEKINAVLNVPVITYVHELAYTIQAYGDGTIQKALTQTTLFLAGSAAVKQSLLQLGIADSRVDIVPSSVPVADIKAKLATIDVTNLRSSLNLQAHEQLVTAVGSADWRKGNDLFVQMAAKLLKTRPHTHFVWVGIYSGSLEHMRMSYDIAHYKIEDRFHLVPVTPDYLKYIAAADIFVLSSREDPFPLVVLEAAIAGKPTVCFTDTGETPDFVGTKHGAVAPYGDIEVMSRQVDALLADESMRLQLGANAHDTTSEKHDNLQAATRIAEILQKTMGN